MWYWYFGTQSVDYVHILFLCLFALPFIMCASNVPCGIGVPCVHPVSWLDSHSCCDCLVLHVGPLFLKTTTLFHLRSPFGNSNRKGPIVPQFKIPSVSSDLRSAVVSSRTLSYLCTMPCELDFIICAMCANCVSLVLRLGYRVSLFRVDVISQTDHQVLSAYKWQTKILILVGVYVLFICLHSCQFIINIYCMWFRLYPMLFLVSVAISSRLWFRSCWWVAPI